MATSFGVTAKVLTSPVVLNAAGSQITYFAAETLKSSEQINCIVFDELSQWVNTAVKRHDLIFVSGNYKIIHGREFIIVKILEIIN